MDMKISSVTDLATKQVVLLDHAKRTAQTLPVSGPTGPAAPVKATAGMSFTPGGETRTIDGLACEARAFHVSVNVANATGPNIPPQAAAMVSDLKIVLDGTAWIATSGGGAAEYVQFQQSAAKSNLAVPLAVLLGGQRTSIGLENVLSIISSAPGIPCLAEVVISAEGTSEIANRMRLQMAGTKVSQRISDLSTAALADEVFTVPAGYKLVK